MAFILHYQVVEGQPNTIHTNWTADELKYRYHFLRDGRYIHHASDGREVDICAHCCVRQSTFERNSRHVDPGVLLTSYGLEFACAECKAEVDGPFVTVVHYSFHDNEGTKRYGMYKSNIPITQRDNILQQIRRNHEPKGQIGALHTIGSREEAICVTCCRARLGERKSELGHDMINIVTGTCEKCEAEWYAKHLS